MAKKEKVQYKDKRPYIVNNLKYTLKRGGEFAAEQPAKIYGTIGDGGKLTGNITLNKNKAGRAAADGEISGTLDHESVQKYLGKGSNAEKQLLADLEYDKPHYTEGQAYADDLHELVHGVGDMEFQKNKKGNLEISIRRTNPANKK